MTTQHNIEQNTPEWFAARKGRVTASNIGAILGLDPNRTRADVLRMMVREANGLENEFKGNIATEYGKRHEKDALESLKIQFQAWDFKDGHYCTTEIAGVPCGASPDGFGIYQGNIRVIEIKCPFGLRNDNDPTFKDLDEQPHYKAQIMFQMLVTGVNKCVFFQWNPYGSQTEIQCQDNELTAKIIDELPKFWAEYQEALANPEPYLQDKVVTIDDEVTQAKLTQYLSVVSELKDLEELKKQYLDELVKMTGERDCVIMGKKLSKTTRAGSVSYAKVVADHLPNLDLTKYTGKPISYWQVR
jgi:exodeoxyribonuclease (lambda-induced)